MSIRPDQIERAMEPLRFVDREDLDEIASALKGSKSKQKRAVGTFLDRINRIRIETVERPRQSNSVSIYGSGLTDLGDE